MVILYAIGWLLAVIGGMMILALAWLLTALWIIVGGIARYVARL